MHKLDLADKHRPNEPNTEATRKVWDTDEQVTVSDGVSLSLKMSVRHFEAKGINL